MNCFRSSFWHYYGEMYKAVRHALVSMNDIPAQIKQFEPDNHECSVLQALEWLLSGDARRFCNYRIGSRARGGLRNLDQATFQDYKHKAAGFDEILRWALLLHDIAKGRGLPGPHPENCAYIAGRVLQQVGEIKKHEKRLITWLVKYHAVLGNIYTGERSPAFLLDIAKEAGLSEAARGLDLLQVVMLCDIRGMDDGAYLTEQRAQFWLGLSTKAQIRDRQRKLLSWRLTRWTGDLVGRNRGPTKKALSRMLAGSRLVRSAFGKRISYIVYGFYLFTALDSKQLATLMQIISHAASCVPGTDLTLIFEKVYRPPSPHAKAEDKENAERALRYYADQLGKGTLKVGVDLRSYRSGKKWAVTSGHCIYCP